MEKDKSPIQSTSVSLYSQTSNSGRAAALQGEPWNILICGDFGFSSEKPQRVHISEWNDFLSRNRVILSGNVSDCLSGVDKLLFVECRRIRSGIFPPRRLKNTRALLTPFRDAVAALNDLLDGKIDSDRANALIEKTTLPSINKHAIRGLLGKRSSPAPASFHLNLLPMRVSIVCWQWWMCRLTAKKPVHRHWSLMLRAHCLPR